MATKKTARRAPKIKKFWIGFDLGGTKMLACVLDDKFKVIAEAKKNTNGSDGDAKGKKKIVQAIKDAIESAGYNKRGLQGIGIGCPGLVDPKKGVLHVAPNLGWKAVNLRKLLNDEFKCPVAVLNDVDAGTYGEFKLGAGKGSRSMLGVFPGTGLGGGFVYDGKLIRGKSISCMEIGNILFPGTHLGSAEFGTVTLEDLTSRLALASSGTVACYRGQAPDLQYTTAGNLREMRSKAIAGSFKAGDEAMMVMLSNSIRYLGMGVAMVVNLLAPDHITLGGGLVEEMKELYLKRLEEEVRRYAMPELSRGLKYSFAKLGSYAVATGAVAYLQDMGEE
jgi:glucokinase